MDLHQNLVSLVEALSRKSSYRGPEAMAYIRGIEFVEKLYEFNSLVLDKQMREFKKREGIDDQDYVSSAPESI